MHKLATILMVLLITGFAFSQSKKLYQYHNYIPSKNGIQHYIDLNKTSVIKAVENFIGDTLNSYNISTDNLSEYHLYDSLEAGRFYPEDVIIITNELKFYDYELMFVPKWKQKEFNNNTKFVKGVLIHELVHLYIYQFISESLENNIPINIEYINFNMFPTVKSHYALEFIEEGICEYVVMKLKEGIFRDYKLDCPERVSNVNVNEFMQNQNSYAIRYQYSRSYVQKIFEVQSFKNALLVIFTCKPPSYEELVCPEQYYQRLTQNAQDLFIL